VCLGLAVAAAAGCAGTGLDRGRTINAEVIRVVDGDTLVVRALGRTAPSTYRVRVLGIDAPEAFGDGECGSEQAAASMAELAPTGARVSLRTDPGQSTFDRFDRLLAYVQRGGRDLGRVQVARGWATTYVYQGSPFRRVDGYRRSEAAARRSDRGVFGRCAGRLRSP
jgi:endonuclease YncB( thermonuclease family)